MEYIYALDIGSEQDFCAGMLLKKHTRIQQHPAIRRDTSAGVVRTLIVERHLIHTYRPPLRTPYDDVIRRVNEIVNHSDLYQNCYLVVDKGQVGGAIVQNMIRIGMRPYAINITGGSKVTEARGGWNVPKADLVGALILALEQQTFRTHPNVVDRETLIHELKSFRMKRRVSGHMSFEAERDRDHDDMVMSLAMGIWFSDRVWPNGGLERENTMVRMDDGSIVFEDRGEKSHETYGP